MHWSSFGEVVQEWARGCPVGEERGTTLALRLACCWVAYAAAAAFAAAAAAPVPAAAGRLRPSLDCRRLQGHPCGEAWMMQMMRCTFGTCDM